MQGQLCISVNGSEHVFNGHLFGDVKSCGVSGEVVFQTGQVGYVESLSDPSYRDQILVLTYPLIGNYGVPDLDETDTHGIKKNLESDGIHVQALVVGEYVESKSHHSAKLTLNEWLIKERVVGISGVDTRAITILVRNHGSLRGVIRSLNPSDGSEVIKAVKPMRPLRSTFNLEGGNDQSPSVLVVDCGMKNNQLRCLLNLGLNLTVCNHETKFSASSVHYQGIFISNGPGDPKDYTNVIDEMRIVMTQRFDIAIFGICLGHQILAIAAGGQTSKMKFGHRGHNIPCKLEGTHRTFMTSQNHGYEVSSCPVFPSGVDKLHNPVAKELFFNLNDNTNEGLYWTNRKWFSCQFHPEAKSGPTDTLGLFRAFYELMSPSTGVSDTRRIIDRILLGAENNFKFDRPKQYRKVLVLGSGGLSIGQSGEFDYSGSQAIKAYREAGLMIILVNPNIATVQTSPEFVDKVYYIPITPEYVEQVIESERPDCISLSFGGQTALNTGSALFKSGVLKRFNVDVLGTSISSIDITEDRELFKKHVISIGEKVCESGCANTVDDAVSIATSIGFPVLVRAAFALGGLGSGFANDESELRKLLSVSFSVSDQVIIDKSFRGWKELEYEIVRDRFGNCINVCNMENLDPLGVHTGESIVVAPSQTLTDSDHFKLREVALKTVASLDIIGECNIQFTVNPLDSSEFYIIEVNARLSRSSALASKATGYPLAYIAAKLTLGSALDELKNSMTDDTSACFEPSLDYCVVKVPRWDLTKFEMVDTHVGSAMKSVGEGMAISRTFEEALQSAIRMSGIDEYGLRSGVVECSDDALSNPTYQRILAVATGIRSGYTIDRISELSGIDDWFLNSIEKIVLMQSHLEQLSSSLDSTVLCEAKRLGFSDKFIALCTGSTHVAVRDMRLSMGIRPSVQQIDTVAAEFPCRTNYMYLTYAPLGVEPKQESHPDLAMVLGSGVYKIGSSVEFDWCAVSCIRELRRLGKRVIMVNCNPETVSTDYDEADVLCFTEVSLECVLDTFDAFQPGMGVVISVGGQLPNNMAMDLWHRQVPVLGTQPESIDGAENRYKFSRMLDVLGVDQPKWKELSSVDSARGWCNSIGYPVLVRPSYVLSGAAMNVAYSDDDLDKYLSAATHVSRDHPVVISQFIAGAKEIEVDAVADHGVIYRLAVSEHVENAGVHSGDATLVFPAQDLTEKTIKQITDSVRSISAELNITGPFNMQFIAKNDRIMVIECNLRVSRSFPFVSKTMGTNLVSDATRVMLGLRSDTLADQPTPPKNRIGVKVAQFSFNRLPGADILLGVEMRSTGEVACFGENAPEAFLKALTASNVKIPPRGSSILLSVGGYDAKKDFRSSVLNLISAGYVIYATHNTADYINTTGGRCEELSMSEIHRRISDKSIKLIVNITERNKMRSNTSDLSAGYKTRRLAVDMGVPVITDIKAAKLLVVALCSHFSNPMNVSTTAKVRSSVDCFTHYRTIRIPGLIDVHVHTRDMEESHKEDWLTCSQAALSGGITMICAMPNTKPPVIDRSSFDNTVKVAQSKSVCDFGIIAGSACGNANSIGLVTEAVGLKMYLNSTHGTNGKSKSVLSLPSTSDWISAIRGWKDENRPICVHAEGETLAAVLYAHSMVTRSGREKRKLHVCHVSTSDDIELVRLAKEAGQSVTCEVAPHHLFHYSDDGEISSHLSSVKPPLARREDRDALWANMDIIDCFATDHAPHTIHEKTCNSCPGFPGLETALPLLLTAVDENFTIDDIVLRYHTNPKRIFNLPDQPDTYVDIDPDFEHIINRTPHYSKCGWTPFGGRKVRGVVKRVVLRGKLVFVADHPDESRVIGTVLAAPGSGKFVVPVSKPLSPPTSLSLIASSIGPFKTIVPTKTPSAASAALASDKHFVSVDGLTKDYLRALFKSADNMKRSGELSSVLAGKTMTLFFSEASTRTRVSFEAAMNNLGGKVIYISSSDSSVQKGETLEDTVRCLAGVSDALVIRHSKSGSASDALRALSALNSVTPIRRFTHVINGGDGTNEHPTQTLVDLYTIRQEIGTLGGICVVMVGDLLNGRTVHSLAKALCLRNNVILHYVSPDGLGMPDWVCRYVAAAGVEQHHHSALTDDLVAVADVLYMTRLQLERLSTQLGVYPPEFCLTPHKLAKAKPSLRVLHPLPRGPEISTDVDSDSRAAYVRQMHNGLPVRMALLESLLLN